MGAGESTAVQAPTTSFGFAKTNPFKARLSCCLPRASYDTLGILCVMSLTVAAVQNEEPAHGGGHR